MLLLLLAACEESPVVVEPPARELAAAEARGVYDAQYQQWWLQTLIGGCEPTTEPPPAPSPIQPTAPVHPDSVVITTPTNTITALGDTLRLTAQAFAGQPVESTFKWSYMTVAGPRSAGGKIWPPVVVTNPSDTMIITVDSTGLVTAIGNSPGYGISTTVYAVAPNNVADSLTITVRQVITSVTLRLPDPIFPGHLEPFEVSATDANGREIYDFWIGKRYAISVIGGAFAIASSDTMVAIVDPSAGSSTDPAGGGILVARQPGTTEIAARADNTDVIQAETLTVSPAPAGYPHPRLLHRPRVRPAKVSRTPRHGGARF